MTIRIATPEELPACFEIRHAIFVVDQFVPAEVERDEHDETATHFVCFEGDDLVGTARFRISGDLAKAERVAVKKSHRRRGHGEALMKALEDHARELGHDELHLHAQGAVVSFYERLGYDGYGGRFLEAGKEHWAMKKPL